MNETLRKVVDYIRKAIEEHPIKEEGKTYQRSILYRNGNDGTRFDWVVNNRTCEFFVFYDTGEDALGYIKAYVTRFGTIEGYVWNTERYEDGEMLDPEPLADDYEEPTARVFYHSNGTLAERRARRFCKWLFETRDEVKIWDEEIATL